MNEAERKRNRVKEEKNKKDSKTGVEKRSQLDLFHFISNQNWSRLTINNLYIH